ncbi:alkaline shock response membrane anchor protein AmaP [Neomoorella thermoacetica]|uniref:Alkaline shock response membrane anchor protein AmaP n=2 Tax=Neomoorella thermoacetica TaxID=1525 RepID=A0AAC9MUX8_NEOTH|nr:alkaline shock response membrane anchor protein AmaP [Moorella thermoacetica]AKX94308.1 hypothetical protein MOTHE_c15150 [Moorella thermoacetica]AKX96945.1 hypothetical protein MOTHA_c15990 [Moorella thermoacetica]AOQ24255.1 hypothetical protein Maut_01818 [Moorella thermoacetica]OIQ54420.1 hypothetical protein MORE_13890 [Moorella thermoacetica]OIQ58116.1 hypothetical protein MOCA_05410 [Moorella thermoacetica]
MSVLDRALLALFALITAILAGIFLAVIAGWSVPLDLFELSLLNNDYRLLAGVVALIFFLLAMRFLLGSLRLAQAGEGRAVIKAADLGLVSISLPALEHLVTRAARQVKGVREIRPRLNYGPEGLAIRLNITVNPDRNLPEMAAELQEKVREYVIATAGLEVPEVQVRINGIFQEGQRRVE